MANSKPKEESLKNEPQGWYKGYDMKWLRKEVDHPDFHLVAEYDELLEKSAKK